MTKADKVATICLNVATLFGGDMETVGIKEIKNNLSRYLARVKLGEEILITDRGKPVARIIKEDGGKNSIRQTLGPLIAKGVISMPGRAINRKRPPLVDVPGKKASEMVLEDRR